MAALTVDDVDDVVARIETDGYAVIRGVVPREPLAQVANALGAEYERQRASGELFNGGGTLSGHLNCFPGEHTRFVHDALRERGVLDLIEALSPDELERIRVTMNFNLPGSRAQHYHSDGLFTEGFYICNIAVIDTDLTNGAIDLLPGTHQRFYKFYDYALQRKYRSSTRLCMEQGDVLIRKSTLWHRGMPNHTSEPRPMMSITFGETSAPEGDAFRVHEGRVRFYPNWYGTSRIGQYHERAVVTMPWLYSGFRFARSLVGNKGYSSW